jgi:poly-gamma-glutamate synthesis protein (capsule biosynthesis protein)
MDTQPGGQASTSGTGVASRAIRLLAVGDLQLGDSPTTVGFGFRSRYPDVSAMQRWTRHVGELVAGADIVVGNLECVLSDRGLRSAEWESYQMRGIPAYAQLLRSTGFTVLNIANNHAMQHKSGAFEDTVAALSAAGIAIVGLRGERPWRSSPTVLSVSGRRIGLLGYSFRPRQYSQDPPLYAEGDADAVCADVRHLKPTVDHVVVSLHWGEEFVPTPSEAEVATAEAVVAAGAEVIVGHHPHVLRGLHRIGRALVAYSLGNFSGDMLWYAPFRTGGILKCELGGGVRGKIDAVRVGDDYIPRLTGSTVDAVEEMASLSADAYDKAVHDTINAQRWGSYLYALRNVHRFRLRALAQLVMRTFRNKVLQGPSGGPHGPGVDE